MKLKKFNTKTFMTSLVLVMTSVTCSGCKLFKEEVAENKISYDELVNDYKVIDIVSFDKHNFHIVKKEQIENSCYGYYDLMYHNCIVKVDDEACTIISKGFIDNLYEYEISDYLEKYDAVCDGYTIDDLGYIISWIRDDYEEKVLVKERD